MIELTFSGVMYKFTTLVDGGGRITLDIPETEMTHASQMIALRGKHLQIGLVEINSEINARGQDHGVW